MDTLRRVELLRELRLGEYDVLVGINLLREGLDLPEVSLVAILDADKEGFLRSGRSLIQTIGRAARNVSGEVHMYADTITPSMKLAIDETNRRRDEADRVQRGPRRRPAAAAQAHRGHHRPRWPARTPTPPNCSAAPAGSSRAARPRCPASRSKGSVRTLDVAGKPAEELLALIEDLSQQMHAAAAELQFELAARFRDEIGELKKELRVDAGGYAVAGRAAACGGGRSRPGGRSGWRLGEQVG